MKLSWHEKLFNAVSVFILADLVTAWLLMNFTVLDDVTSLAAGVLVGILALLLAGR